MAQRSCIAQVLWAAALLAAGSVLAQQDREALGQAAEKAAQYGQALDHYTAALQTATPGSDAEWRLLERAASVSSKVRPLPALPPDAERRFIRGQTAVQGAGSTESFQRAAEEFHAAVRVAPWLADAYYNLGVVLDKAQRYDEAIRALKLYMLAAPSAKDASEAQRLIYQIEFRQEEVQRAKAKSAAVAAARAEEQRRLGFLAGRWEGTLTTNWSGINPSIRPQIQTTSVSMDVAINGLDVVLTRPDTGRAVLVGKISGNDAASIRWQLPPGFAYPGEAVTVQVDPNRIRFAQPVRNSNGARIDNAMTYELRR